MINSTFKIVIFFTVFVIYSFVIALPAKAQVQYKDIYQQYLNETKGNSYNKPDLKNFHNDNYDRLRPSEKNNYYTYNFNNDSNDNYNHNWNLPDNKYFSHKSKSYYKPYNDYDRNKISGTTTYYYSYESTGHNRPKKYYKKKIIYSY